MVKLSKKHIIIIFILGSIVYFNSLLNGFVWDDEEQVLNNGLIRSLHNIPLFFSTSTFNTGGTGSLGGLYYKPLMTLSFSIIYNLFGPYPFFFHLLQVLLHIVNALLVYAVFAFFLPLGLALTGALFFLVHPLNTETVVYISDLQDILFFFFGMLAFSCLRKTQAVKYPVINILFVSILLLLSLLSKETGVLFIALVLIYLASYQRRQIFSFLAGVTVSLLVYSYLRFNLAGIYFNKHGLSPITTIPLDKRLLSIPQIIVYYLKTFIYPKDLAINQHWAILQPNLNNFYLPLLLVIFFMSLIASGYFYLRAKSKNDSRIYLFFTGWFLVGLGAHLQIVPLDLTVSERWFYFPIVGLLGMVLTIIKSLTKGKTHLSLIIIMSILLLILSTRTIIRNMDWRNGLTLYSQDIKISKVAFDLENNLGVELFRIGQINEAKPHFQRSTELAPHWWTNWNNLGVIAEREGNFSKALEYYQKGIDNGSYYLSYENKASVLVNHDSTASAEEFIQSSLQKLPYNAKLWMLLAVVEDRLGKTEQANQAAKNYYSLSK